MAFSYDVYHEMKIKSHLREFSFESHLGKGSTENPGELLDCSLGINHFGFSERILAAAKHYDWSSAAHYPDPTYADLKDKITQFWSHYAKLDHEQIHIGRGASGVLATLNKIFIQSGVNILGYFPQWRPYGNDVEAGGGELDGIVLVPQENFKFVVEKIVKKITVQHCLVYVDNPNNPTGQVVDLEGIEAILRHAQRMGVVVVIDEAYGDYVGKENSAISLINKFENLVVVRSFSKAFGLAGLRVGYGVFSLELARFYHKVDMPFPVSSVAAFLAVEALSDEGFIIHCRDRVQEEKTKLIAELASQDYLTSETAASCPIFVLGRRDAGVNLEQDLLDRGILTLGGEHFKHLANNYVRVSTPCKAEEFLSRLSKR